MAQCRAFDPLSPYATELVGFVSCHARALGEEGYNALGTGSPVGLAISGLIAIYIALIGYRLLLGGVLSLGHGVASAFKIGLVVALSTQWAAYHVLVYDVVVSGPDALAARVLAPSGLGGDSADGLTARIQSSYAVLDALLHPDPALIVAAPSPLPESADGSAVAPPRRASVNIPSPILLSTASAFLLVGTLAGLLSVRVVAGLLLALGPIFIGCFLFETMRGLFVGWVRGLAGVALGAVAVPAVIALEMAVLAPQVQALAAAVAAGELIPILSGEILATTALFGLIILAALVVTARTAAGFRLPDPVRNIMTDINERRPTGMVKAEVGRAADPTMLLNNARSRASSIADAVFHLDRHEARATLIAQSRRSATIQDIDMRDRADDSVQPLGQRARRGAPRASMAATRRDAVQ
ncbi:MAG: type IV secretion system protein [Sphingomonas sp.]|jgi:type IV secretion system protein VirB6